eukprot:CAMPEP_0171351968 /NCGR_PEP_ID=MMETSP0878-20121228/40300_1 /TAXON_ID=67004 /ORGANISM="Thalassiosira weissflogii, Strain CCMP1336" /LENGTH=175 /DNA_ID=CAMNT_0011857413 /DNA_START=209 /DNA_END=736 /DNA_ORIENTATION=+
MKTCIHLRMYSHPTYNPAKNQHEHSYYVGHEPGGLSPRLGLLAIDPTITTFLQLREHIEETEGDGGRIRKRTLFFQEFLFFMERCSNPYGYGKEDLKNYRIGVLRVGDVAETKNGGDGEAVPNAKDIKLIREDVETEPIFEVVGDVLGTDFVLIPSCQLHPETGRLFDADEEEKK